MSDSGATLGASKSKMRAVPGNMPEKIDMTSREGCIEQGDVPLTISSSCKIRNEIFHMVTFKQSRMTSSGGTTRHIREQIKPRLYKSKVLREIAVDFLVDYYES